MDARDGGELLERETELATLDRLLESARNRTGSVAIVLGPPGTGKTALLAAARERARAQGMAVCSACAGVLEREHPFGVAGQLLGPGGRTALKPPDQLRSTGELMFDKLARLYGQLAGMAGDGSLLVCVDDAHWADVESLRLCAYLAARIESLPAALVVGVRTGENEPERELLAVISAGASILTPAPLTDRGVAAFIAAALEVPVEEPFAAACAHEELLAAGARPRKMLSGGPDALTPAEQRVATMAAEGLTNRQIAHALVLSVRTVETHLAHSYAKLGLNSRTQLADALAARTTPPGSEDRETPSMSSVCA